MLNDGKTEFLLIGTRQQLAKINIRGINVGSDVISPAFVVRNLDAWFNSQLTICLHILAEHVLHHIITCTSGVFGST